MRKLKIAHVTAYAPGCSGLYEASRDLAKADILSGHEVYIVDAGVFRNGKMEPGKPGQIDDRSGYKLETSDPFILNDVDLTIMHTGVADNYLVKSNCPLLWIVHGKPLDTFRPEEDGLRVSYSMYENVSKWSRTVKMVYFWEEYHNYWKNVFPADKHLVFKYPVIDRARFKPEGEIYQLKNKGKYNVLIADSTRADINLFELVNGCIEAARQIPGIKFHFVGQDRFNLNCWQILLKKLQEVNGLGDVIGRTTEMANLYRAVDLTFSPNRIINRVVAESLCCNVPVLQEKGSLVSDYNCYVPDVMDVVEGLKLFVSDFDKGIHKDGVLERSKVFDLKPYQDLINKVYESIT